MNFRRQYYVFCFFTLFRESTSFNKAGKSSELFKDPTVNALSDMFKHVS